MAIRPDVIYPGQIDTTDPTGYPYGAARNDVVLGDGQGTPLEKGWVKDLFGFEQALLATAGITPSGVQEKVGASQYLAALSAVATSIAAVQSVVALQKVSPANWPTRSSFDYPSFVNMPVHLAYDPTPTAQSPTQGGLILCATDDSLAMVSDDGTDWANASALVIGVKDVAAISLFGTRTFLASAISDTKLYKTTNGAVTWSLASSSLPLNSTLASFGGILIAAGDAGAVKTSLDGSSWTARTTPANWIANSGGVRRAVGAAGVGVVLLPVASYNKCLFSPDSINWTEQALPATGGWTGLAYSVSDGLWMASSGGTLIATSPDGLVWTGLSTAVASNDLAVSGSVWAMATAGGASGGIALSSDKGLSWSKVSVGNHRTATNGWSRIIAADKRFVVAHATGARLEFALSQRSP